MELYVTKKSAFPYTNIDIIYYCLRNFVWIKQSIINFILALSHALIDSQKECKSFANRSWTVSVAEMLERYAGKKGLLLRFPVQVYASILNLSRTSRCSQFGEDHTNEINHDIHAEMCS